LHPQLAPTSNIQYYFCELSRSTVELTLAPPVQSDYLVVLKEWDHFLRIIIAGGNDDKAGGIPRWLDDELAAGVISLKNNLSELYQKAGLEDQAYWKSWIDRNDCESNFPQDKRFSLFQQVLVVQALRPDRLQVAMKNFACRLLSIKDISPLTSNIKMLYETETVANEPILIIISPGADPSQELSELAESVVGKQCYHEVAMGQGQMNIALDLLKKCSANGEWLCLKNLHLVIAWLSTLEKVCVSSQLKIFKVSELKVFVFQRNSTH
jgi:dynein heavy chain 2